jgi:hypothetical protein
MEEKYKKFLEFSWKDSSDWQLYYSNLFPTPPGNKIEHFKKKWYKLKIDPDFDTTWTPSEPSSNTNYNQSQSSYSYPNASTMSRGLTGNLDKVLSLIEAFLWGFFLFTIIYHYHTLKIVSLALLVRVLRRVGLPKFQMIYAQQLFLDEHFQILLYALLFMIDRLNIFILIPLGITAILNLAEFFRSNHRIFKSIIPYTDKIINKRVELALARANAEVAIGFFLFLGIFLGLNSFLIPIFYWQYLRFKYIVNEDTKISFRKLNNFADKIKNHPSTPGPIKFIIDKIQQFASFMGRTESAPGQAAGGQNCTIF